MEGLWSHLLRIDATSHLVLLFSLGAEATHSDLQEQEKPRPLRILAKRSRGMRNPNPKLQIHPQKK